jgi:thiamine-phosphate diphosphorylase
VFTRPAVCVITSRRRLVPDARTAADEILALHRWLDDAINAGADVIQIREPDLEAAPLRDLTRATVARAAGTATRVLVNDRADVAGAADAHGVHLRGDGPAVAGVRRIGPGGWVVGRSIHSAAEAHLDDRPDYFLFGTVFPSLSKPGAPPSGLEPLRCAAAEARVPVLAIGGITPARAIECSKAGARGVAAIGLFLPPRREAGALGPAEGVRRLRAALEAAVLE